MALTLNIEGFFPSEEAVKASIEGKISDSETGELLLAAVDRGAGGKRIEGTTSQWADVEAIFDYWADRLALRLRQLRGETSMGIR